MADLLLSVILIIPVFYFLFKGLKALLITLIALGKAVTKLSVPSYSFKPSTLNPFKRLWSAFYFHAGDRFKRKALSIRLDKVWMKVRFQRSYMLFRVFGSLLVIIASNGYILISFGEKGAFWATAIISLGTWGLYIWFQMIIDILAKIKDIRGKKNQSNITENTDQE